jgi:hypothetical protein
MGLVDGMEAIVTQRPLPLPTYDSVSQAYDSMLETFHNRVTILNLTPIQGELCWEAIH